MVVNLFCIGTYRADARWLAPPRAWTLGPQLYNTLHLTHSTYANKNIDLSEQMLMKAFSTASAQRIQQTDLSIRYASS